MKPLILLGPTAAGKTALAVELAKKLNGEIISADSMQVYRGMDIGTAKPTLEERQGIPHYLIDIRDPDEPWTVSDFVDESQKLEVKIKNEGKTPIIVGGTGLYLWTLLNGYSFPITPADPELRTRLEKELLSTLYSQLSTIDPQAAARIHRNDKKRIIRALEVYELTGTPISELQTRNPQPVTRYLLLGLDLPRDQLYSRVDRRVDEMVAKGLIEEVSGLLAKGYAKELPSFQALGYKEAVKQLAGEWSRETMVAELKKRTRHFARRQLTWFRRFSDVHWLSPPIDIGQLLDYIKGHDQDQTARN